MARFIPALPSACLPVSPGLTAGFISRYGCKLLVWYEAHDAMLDAIAREKQIKAGSRRGKLALIETMNPLWRDLYDEL